MSKNSQFLRLAYRAADAIRATLEKSDKWRAKNIQARRVQTTPVLLFARKEWTI